MTLKYYLDLNCILTILVSLALSVMNYLAHLYLSGDNRAIQAGNLFGDEIKGRDFSHLPKEVAIGVSHHRFIDSYTDSHELNLEIKSSLYSEFGKYSGVALDIYYDHFLAKNWKDYSELSLALYAQEAYEEMNLFLPHFSQKSAQLLHYMKKQDWLTNYSHLEGMERTFMGMSKRLPEKSGIINAKDVLVKHYSRLEWGFREYFVDLLSVAQVKLLDLRDRNTF